MLGAGAGAGVGGGWAKATEAIVANLRACGLKAEAKGVGARVFVCAAQSYCRAGLCFMCAVAAGFVDLRDAMRVERIPLRDGPVEVGGNAKDVCEDGGGGGSYSCGQFGRGEGFGDCGDLGCVARDKEARNVKGEG